MADAPFRLLSGVSHEDEARDRGASDMATDMAALPIHGALEALGQAITRLEEALTRRQARETETEAASVVEGEQRARDMAALRGEYESLRDEYGRLREAVELVDGRLDGTITRLRAMLEG